MIYLLGTYHELQHTGAVSKERPRKIVERRRRDLRLYLHEKILEFNVALVAEEFSQFLTTKGCESIAGDVAKELSIEHRLCDPGPKERDGLGIPHRPDCLLEPDEMKARDEIRERYWMKRISDKRDSNILFVCGADHVASFEKLLVENGWHPKVLEPCWGADIYESEDE